jgi:antitoxin component YwqK of YwqJK toxin-antitoxin module
MKPLYGQLLATLILASGCQTSSSCDSIVSQKFVHKYGFDLSENEWEQRSKDGQVVQTLKNGVKVTSSYENGVLHGLKTYTFAGSDVIEKALVYDQGTLLKETIHDASGIPSREELYEFDDRLIITLWDQKGVPLSVEEYDGELLVDGKYYTTDHQLEGEVVDGRGDRIVRERSGLLVSKDRMEGGRLVTRTTYHPNGQSHTVSHYHDYQLHGEQLKYTASGKPLMTLTWDHGVLNGPKTVFRNGLKVAEIPYVDGHKHGTEIHFDDLGTLTAEIEWKNDKKHGPSKFYTEEQIETEWFYKGHIVNANKFEMMINRESLLEELHKQ